MSGSVRSGASADGSAEVRRELRARIRRSGAKRVAHDVGVTPQRLYQVRSGESPPSRRLAEALGFRRVVRFERVESSEGGR